jgi:hypothetical protein
VSLLEGKRSCGPRVPWVRAFAESEVSASVRVRPGGRLGRLVDRRVCL